MHRFFPSPTVSAVHFGFLTIHFYALAILIGIVCAIYVGRISYSRAGGDPEEIVDIAFYAIPSGIIGGRLYHVVTTPDSYFGKNDHPLDSFKIWEGGMGIWGAIALGTFVSYKVFNRKKRSLTFLDFADALAPGLFIAQGIGRWGNYFNIELFGKPSELPWALSVPLSNRPIGYETFQSFHPTFLYESLWCLAGAALLFFLSRRANLKSGSLFLGYIAFYCLGRLGIESLRIDAAHHLLGMRINIWVSALGFCVASLFLYQKAKPAR
jgi:prolipoprotein diacylglyceryl transferase